MSTPSESSGSDALPGAADTSEETSITAPIATPRGNAIERVRRIAGCSARPVPSTPRRRPPYRAESRLGQSTSAHQQLKATIAGPR